MSGGRSTRHDIDSGEQVHDKLKQVREGLMSHSTLIKHLVFNSLVLTTRGQLDVSLSSIRTI